MESSDFNEEHYLCDQFENNEQIDKLRLAPIKWLDNYLTDEFTEDEQFRLKNLPKKDFTKLSNEEKNIILYGLIDILYAYCYDKRVNDGEQTCESAWTIAKISSTLSCFETFTRFDDLLVSCIRRSLCYPIYRNYELSKSIIKDVIRVLEGGLRTVIKILLDIQKLFNEYGEFKYLLNELYINDYIVAIQYLHKKYLIRSAEMLKFKESSFKKDRLNLDLILLHKAAEWTILEQIKSLNL